METTSTTSTTSVASSVQSATSRTSIASDFDTFLQMLTAQARYQDPLEPIDSTEYASQLAQFSSVEQQVQTNDLLTSMITQLGASDLAQYAGWIGMEARSTAPVLFEGQDVTVVPNPPAEADELSLVIYNEEKNEVGRIALPVSSDTFTWNGDDGRGNTLPNGVYSLILEPKALGETLDNVAAESYSRIVEARGVDGSSTLVTASGSSLAPQDITALR